MNCQSLLAVVALAAAPLAAQQPPKPDKLTPDQLKRLTVVRDGAKATVETATSEAQAHMKELEETANAPKPDTTTLKTHFQAAHNGPHGRPARQNPDVGRLDAGLDAAAPPDDEPQPAALTPQ